MMQCSSLAFSQVMGANTNTTTHKELSGVLAEKGSGGIGLDPVRSEGEPIEIGVKGQPLAVEPGGKTENESSLRSASEVSEVTIEVDCPVSGNLDLETIINDTNGEQYRGKTVNIVVNIDNAPSYP